MDNVLQQRRELHSQLTSLQSEYKQIQQEIKSLREEVLIFFSSIFHFCILYF